MIWLRRLVTVPLGVLFFVLLLVTLVFLQINGTFLDPGYYPDELARADIYEFVLTDVLTSALDEARQIEFGEEGSDFDENPLITSGLTTEDIVASVNRAVPPEWVEALVAESFDQFGRYLAGERDTFVLSPRAGEQAAIVVDEFKSLMRKADAYNLLYDEFVIPTAKDAQALELPLGIDVPVGRLVEGARRVAPAEWVQEQVEGVLDEVTPYIRGERDTFEIRVPLADRVDVALEETKAILREADAYEILYVEVVEPELEGSLGTAVDLPFGVTVSEEEVLSALREVAPPAWVQEQAESVIDDAAPYITGRSDSFSTEISLVDNKRQAQRVLVELVDRKLTEVIQGIEVCTASELRALVSRGVPTGLPSCVPPNIGIEDIKDRFSLDSLEGVEDFVLGSVPDTVVFTDRQIRSALSQAGAANNLDRLDQIRELLRNGCSYTNEDLRWDLTGDKGDRRVICGFERSAAYSGSAGERVLDWLDDVRGFLSEGWTYTDADFEEDLSPEDFSTVDDGRNLFALAQSFKFVIYLPVLLSLVSIGFLGGRGWTGRVAYGAGCLLISAGIVFVIWGPGYESFAKSGPIYESLGFADLDTQRQDLMNDIENDDSHDFPKTARLAANKLFDVAESVVDRFAAGIASSSLNLAIIGLVARLAAIFWAQILDLVGRYRPRGDG